MATTCPHCGQTIRAARKAKAIDVSEPVDTSKLDTKHLFEHYKKTAPNADARFFLETAYRHLTTDEQTALAMLATNQVTNRREHYAQLTAIQDTWRRRKDAATDAAFAKMRGQWMVNSQ